MADKPWIRGPQELLQHGLQHLGCSTDFDARIALISIDNAVELMIRIYLGLPARETGIAISRSKLEDISRNFSTLLDGLEEHAPIKVNGIGLGELEWFHRLRNDVYHEYKGSTVERSHIESYAAIARVLFSNLFAVVIEDDSKSEPIDMTDFFLAWRDLEDELVKVSKQQTGAFAEGRYASAHVIVEILAQQGALDQSFLERFDQVRNFRNALVHGNITPPKEEVERYYHTTEELFDVIEGM